MLTGVIINVLNFIYVIFIIYSFINAVRLIIKREISVFRGVVLILIMMIFLSYFILSRIAYVEIGKLNNTMQWIFAEQGFRCGIESFVQLFVIISGIRYLFKSNKKNK